MKQSLLAIFWIWVFSLLVAAQSEKSVCPKIEVKGDEMVERNVPMSFSVNLGEVAKMQKVQYEWSVSLGKIVNGQGASSITVDTTDLGFNSRVEATVRVLGLPQNCSSTASKNGIVSPIIDPIAWNRYGKISFKDELAYLDAFFADLMNNPTDKGFIVIMNGTNERAAQIKKHIQKLIKHTKYRRFPTNRLTFGIQTGDGLSERITIFWRMPGDAAFSPCEDCEIINGKDL